MPFQYNQRDKNFNPMNQKIKADFNIEGFNINIESLIKNDILPKYFNAPLMCCWEITRNCNFRCLHCYNNSNLKLKTEMSHNMNIDIAKQLVNMKVFRVCLSGGEPLLSKSYWEISKILKEGKVSCNTITNGYHIDETTAQKMSEYFTHVQLSIDGVNPEVHDKIRGVKGSWKRAVKACKLLIKNKTKVSICFVPLKFNIKHIAEMIDFAFEIGAFSFRTEKTKLTGRAVKNINVIPSKKQYEMFERVIEKKREEYKGKMMIEYTSDVPRTLSIVSQYFPPFFCWITPSGIVTLNNTLPIPGGSLKEKSFKEIWNDLKLYHTNPNYINSLNKIKRNEDYLNLSEIPYVNGEMYES